MRLFFLFGYSPRQPPALARRNTGRRSIRPLSFGNPVIVRNERIITGIIFPQFTHRDHVAALPQLGNTESKPLARIVLLFAGLFFGLFAKSITVHPPGGFPFPDLFCRAEMHGCG
jgi:hypothetical protein